MKKEPVDRLIKPIRRLFMSDTATGILLIIMVAIAMIWANSPWAHSYHALWESHLVIGIEDYKIDKSLHHWINDGLMAIFFFVIGLEIKREVISGDLSSWKQASLPAVAAIGGMLVPAGIYLIFNHNTPGESGWGIPMATDIAFTLGLVAIVSSRVPLALKVFLTALAIVDDIGAILVIAIFYTPNIDYINLIYALAFLVVMVGGNLIGIRNRWFYFIVGAAGLWTSILYSGIHATIAGVLAALAIPARVKVERDQFKGKLTDWSSKYPDTAVADGPFISEEKHSMMLEIEKDIRYAMTPLQYLESKLEPLVSYFIIPLFALANAGVTINAEVNIFSNPVTLGVIFGLLLGKFVGITALSQLMIKLGLSEKPKGSNLKSLSGVSVMAGIGFTMSLFLADLAFDDQQLINSAKIGILIASLLASIVGILWFKLFIPSNDRE